MTPIRCGVAGVGLLGYHHARLLSSLDGVELVGVADIDAAHRTRAAEAFTVPGFSRVRGLIECGVDAVAIATPTTTHHDVMLELVQAGVHVLVEKPLASTVAEAETMLAVARLHGVLVQAGHVERFNGAVLALQDAIARPRFVECHRLSPWPQRGSDVSVVHDLMIHDLDIVCALVGEEIVAVDAMGVPVFSANEDIANVRLRFAGGCVANITSSRVSLERMRKIRVFSEDAYVSTDYAAQDVLVYRKKPGPLPAGASPMEHITIDPLPVQRDEPLKLELRAFVDSVRTGQPPRVSGEDGLAALQLAERVVSAIRGAR